MLRRFAVPLALLTLAAGADSDAGKVSGVMFGDYYYVLSADDADATPEKRNAFRLRRVYFTYDRDISDGFDVRVRFEANDAGFGDRDKMVPFVKHAYLRWQDALAGGDLYIGESGTPTWGLSEKAWGYRSVEKTVLDLNGIGSSADIGLALKGQAGGARYHVMVANGPGQRPENDNGKKVYGSISLQPGEGNVLELYGDLDMRPSGQDRLTAKVFLGLGRGDLGLGLEPFVRVDREADPSGDDVTLTGVSVFGSAPVREAWKAFARLDMLSDDSSDTTDLLFIGGLDWAVAPDVHIMPNVHVRLPDGPDPNVQLRATALYRF